MSMTRIHCEHIIVPNSQRPIELPLNAPVHKEDEEEDRNCSREVILRLKAVRVFLFFFTGTEIRIGITMMNMLKILLL